MSDFNILKGLLEMGCLPNPDNLTGEARELALELARMSPRATEIYKQASTAVEVQVSEGELSIAVVVPPERALRAVDIGIEHLPQVLASTDGVIGEFFRAVSFEYGVVFLHTGHGPPHDVHILQGVKEQFDPKVVAYLLALNAWCVAQDVRMILFDRDAELLPGFPTFDW